MPNMIARNNMTVFLTHNILNTLINLIGKNDSETELKIAACRYLKKFLDNVLADCVELLTKVLVLIINTLIPIAREETAIGEESLALLEFLVVDNAVVLSNITQDLDPFPQETKFRKMCDVYHKLRYGRCKEECRVLKSKFSNFRYENVSVTLENEIKHFLNAGSIIEGVGCREEGLKCLRMQLSSKKNELKNLYGGLYEMRGFSEDTHASILHRLICMLVKLTTSENPAVRKRTRLFQMKSV